MRSASWDTHATGSTIEVGQMGTGARIYMISSGQKIVYSRMPAIPIREHHPIELKGRRAMVD